MQGSLGEKIGEGLTADIHAWAPGRVVKLFKPDCAPWLSRHEARMTRAAFAAGAPAPEVLDEVRVNGRVGIVLPRFDGPSLSQLLLTRVMTYEQVGATLAGLYRSIHQTPAPPDVVSLRHWIASSARLSGDLPPDIADGVLALIDRLPAKDGLCHCDLHPGNVLMTADGPRIIDWVCAVRAAPVFDIGRCHITLTELIPEGTDPELPRAINAAVQSEYARLAGMTAAALSAALQPYLPIVRAYVLLQRRPATASQRERLIQRIAAALLWQD